MKKQYKVVKVSENWSTDKLRSKVENELNKAASNGWEVVNISYLANTYIAMITLSK